MYVQGTRGGISCISHKYAKANNPLVGETYDPSLPNSYIAFLDMNNLYGTAMVEPMPQGDFKWLPDDEAATFDLASVPDDAAEGYILECDLEYPDELHDVHNLYPLAPESAVIDYNKLSPYTKSLAQKLGISSTAGKCRKLVTTLEPKRRYTVHYRNLKLYVRLGMVVSKIHRVISLKQSRWLKPYIDFNTEMRKNAKNAFEKDFFKLMNNTVFGKTMENVRKHMSLKLVTDRARLKRMTCKPTFKEFKIISEDLVPVVRTKSKVFLSKPTYVGFTILDISKVFMYEFHYDYMMKKYGPDRAKLLLTDTDSLVYLVQTSDLYRDMMDNLALYDTSDYPKDHAAYSVVNAKRLGCMKDEYNSKPIAEFAGMG